jgi:hypothetical protein
VLHATQRETTPAQKFLCMVTSLRVVSAPTTEEHILMPRGSSDIREIITDFVTKLANLVEQDAAAKARDAILSAFGERSGRNGQARLPAIGGRRGRPPGRPGRPPGKGRRKKAPIQLCPVPGCGNRAAPVFGMVCSKHKDLPKSQIAKYREARRAKKQKAS